MHPAEGSVYMAEKRAGVYDNGLIEHAYASVYLTARGHTEKEAESLLAKIYGNTTTEDIEEVFDVYPGIYMFRIVYSGHFADVTEDYARQTLADEYPTIHPEAWEIG